MAQRVLAVIGAVAFVLAAVVVRNAIDDGGDDDGDLARDDEVVLVCAEDLRAACDAIDGAEVRFEAAAVTAGAIVSGELAADVDAWLTTAAWMEVVSSRAPERSGEAEALASSPTVIATAPGRFDAVIDLCAEADVWRCLGDAAGSDWGDLGAGRPEWRELKVGLMDADGAVGLSVLASAAAGFFGRVDFAANDPAYGEFEGWLANLTEPSGSGDVNPVRTLITRPGTYSAAGSVTALAAPLLGRGVQSIAPATAVSATAVVLSFGGDEPDTNQLRSSLTEAGWTPESGTPAPLLKPGVMAALHTLWTEVT